MKGERAGGESHPNDVHCENCKYLLKGHGIDGRITGLGKCPNCGAEVDDPVEDKRIEDILAAKNVVYAVRAYRHVKERGQDTQENWNDVLDALQRAALVV